MKLIQTLNGAVRVMMPPTIQHEYVANSMRLSQRQLAAFGAYKYHFIMNYLKDKFKMTALKVYAFTLQDQSCAFTPQALGHFVNGEFDAKPIKMNAAQCLDEFMPAGGEQNPFQHLVGEDGGSFSDDDAAAVILQDLNRKAILAFSDSIMNTLTLGQYYTSYSGITAISTLPTEQYTFLQASFGKYKGWLTALKESTLNKSDLLEVADLSNGRLTIDPDKAYEILTKLRVEAPVDLNNAAYVDMTDEQGNTIGLVYLVTSSYYSALIEFATANAGTMTAGSESVTYQNETVNGYTGMILRLKGIPVVVDNRFQSLHSNLANKVFHAAVLTYSGNVQYMLGLKGTAQLDENTQDITNSVYSEVPFYFPYRGKQMLHDGNAVIGSGWADSNFITAAINDFANA